MISLAVMVGEILTCQPHRFVFVVAAFMILILASCQLKGNALGEIQQKNDPYRDTIKSREKRQINRTVVSNGTVQNHHKYYTSQFYPDGRHLWIDLRTKEGSVRDDHLSSNKLAVKSVQLSFEFPFYGHLVTNATLTSGGFINLGASKSRQVANFQYVAPLMAYFNPSLNNTSAVYHFSDGNEFIVQWSNVLLDSNPQAGSFTFQCTLNRTGEIVFSYHKNLQLLDPATFKLGCTQFIKQYNLDIPIPVNNISRAVHAVNIGISDAYYVDKLKHYYGIWQIFRTFYTYDAVNISHSWAVDNAAVVLRLKPSCITARTCQDCTERRKSTEFHCTWCSELKRCSDGFDRHRTEWFSSGCNTSAIFQVDKCATQETRVKEKRSPGLAPWIIAVIYVCAVLVFGSVVWLVYAFTHPNSRSGILLGIQHGPRSCCKTAEKNQDSGPADSSVFNKVLT